MLGTIREKTQGIFAVIIVTILIIPFALWGIQEYFGVDTNPPVATVNGNKILQDNFASAYREQVNQLRGRIDPKLLESGFLKQRVLASMVEEILFNEHANDSGYAVGSHQLNQLIRSQPEFQEAGQFDTARYEAILRANGMDVGTYERRLKYFKLQDQMLSGYKDGAIVTPSEVDDYLRLQHQQRQIEWLMLEPKYFQQQVSVSDEEIKTYYDANRLQFQTPDQVRVEYLELSMDKLVKAYQPKEAELRSEYQRNIDHYRSQPERRASHILVELAPDAKAEEEAKARKRIEELQRKLKQGTSFESLAKTDSDDPLTGKKGGDLGQIRPGVLPARDLEVALAKLKKGEVSDPVRSQFGLHLLKLTEFKPSVVKPYSEVKKALEQTIKNRRGEAAFDEMRDRFADQVYEHAESLKPAAELLGLPIQTSDWLNRQRGGGMFANPQLLNAAFSSQVRQEKLNSELIEAGRNVLVALRLKEDRPAKDRPLSEVKSQIRDRIYRQKMQQAARNVGEDLLQRVRGGERLDKIASGKTGVRFNKLQWVRREALQSGTKNSIDPSVLGRVFAAGQPAAGKPVFGGVELPGKGYVLYAVHQVQPGDPTKADSKQRDAAKALILKRRGSGYYADVLGSLQKQAKVETFPDRLKEAK